VAPMVFMAGDDPVEARRHILDSMAEWSQRGFLLQHWRAMIAEAEVDLYDRQGARAYERLARDARAFKRSMLNFTQYVRAITNFAWARSAIAASYETTHLARRRLREARRWQRRLEREGMPWISSLASLVAASLANAEGDVKAAALHLRAGAEQAHAVDMALQACAARHRLGTLLGGEEGELLVRQAEDAMRVKGVQSPKRYVAVLLPGLWPRAR